jgi:hypothetical protein
MIIGQLGARRGSPAVQDQGTAAIAPDAPAALIERLMSALRAVASCHDCCATHRRIAEEALAAFDLSCARLTR